MAFNIANIIGPAKKNIFPIVCGVIAVAAVVATYWPLGGMIDKLKTEADTRASMYSQLEGLLSQSRQLPLTDPAKTTPDPLTTFPNPKTLEIGTLATKAVSDQSGAMVKFISDLNAAPHTPLVDGVLPTAISSTQKYKFGDIYKLVLSSLPEDTIQSNPRLIEAKQQNLRNDILKGGVPPTDPEVLTAQNALWDNVYVQQVIARNGVQINYTDLRAKWSVEAAKLPESLRTDYAMHHKVYVAERTFTINDAVTSTHEPVPADIWFSQLTLWIQQDIARAIAQTNADYKSILDAPVKHLLKLTIPMTPSPYFGIVLTVPNAAATSPPVPATGGDVLPIQKYPNVSPTGRVSNGMYDVVQFSLIVNIDASQIPKFIETLSQNRLIDVYNINFVSVDSLEARQSGYIYGSAPVVKLTLSCEALFMRSWTIPLMPVDVQKLLNIAQAPPTQASAQ